jgi:hypothetical protein
MGSFSGALMAFGSHTGTILDTLIMMGLVMLKDIAICKSLLVS